MKVGTSICAIVIFLCGSVQSHGERCTGLHESSSICQECDGICPGFGTTPCTVPCAFNDTCGCDEGYWRCFKTKLCETPKRCDELTCHEDNEQLHTCNPCIPDCAQIGKTVPCLKFCILGGICDCKNGFHRNAKNKCVTKDECYRELCPKDHEEYYLNLCQAACGEPPLHCPRNPPAGCGCKCGYCRCGENGPCVTAARCKEMSESTSSTSSSQND